LIEFLRGSLPEWRFEPLACKPAEVPARMSRAAAFVHLSKYEGNSIVCNEAMAQNLPCLFTRVGLMQDAQGPTEVALIEPEIAFGDKAALLAEVRRFLLSLETRNYRPRDWVQQHASLERSTAAWSGVMDDFRQMPWGR
jgi:glycosyltransferase involved in cell wall biosynthesis